MYTINLNWPHSMLGPKILTKEQIFDKVICQHIWPRYSYKNFNEGVLDQQRIIQGYKAMLNSNYSQLARLNSPSDARSLYEAEKKKLEKDRKTNEQLQQIINKNRAVIEEIMEATNDLSFKQYLCSFLVADMDEVPTAIESEKEWCNIQKIKLKTAIDTLKVSIDEMQKTLNIVISRYHKMRRIVFMK